VFLEVKEKRFSDARIIQKNKSKHVSDEIECPVMGVGGLTGSPISVGALLYRNMMGIYIINLNIYII
jgi:hypothetical protein